MSIDFFVHHRHSLASLDSHHSHASEHDVVLTFTWFLPRLRSKHDVLHGPELRVVVGEKQCIIIGDGNAKLPCLASLCILPATENIDFLFINISLSALGNLLLTLRLEALHPFMLPGRRTPGTCYQLSDQL